MKRSLDPTIGLRNKTDFRSLIMRRHIDRDHLFDEVFEKQDEDYFTCPPRCTALNAIKELCRYFLGDDWYVAMPLSQEQANAQIVYYIENYYRGAEIKDK